MRRRRKVFDDGICFYADYKVTTVLRASPGLLNKSGQSDIVATVLRVAPTLLKKSGQWVNVRWTGVNLPTKHDWVGLWVLPNIKTSINAKEKAPVKYQVYGSIHVRDHYSQVAMHDN